MTDTLLETQNTENTNTESTDSTVAETDSTVAENTESTNTENDYSYIPEKFIKDGQPDFQKMTESYKALEEKMGSKIAPESANDYEYDLNTELFDETGYNDFKQQAHDLGLSQDQFSQLMNTYTSRMEAVSQTGVDVSETLKTDWGNDFDANVQNAQRAFNALNETGIDPEVAGTDPIVMKILAYFGSQMTEDSVGKTQAGISRLTQADAEQLMGDPEYYEITAKGAEMRKKVESYFTNM